MGHRKANNDDDLLAALGPIAQALHGFLGKGPAPRNSRVALEQLVAQWQKFEQQLRHAVGVARQRAKPVAFLGGKPDRKRPPQAVATLHQSRHDNLSLLVALCGSATAFAALAPMSLSNTSKVLNGIRPLGAPKAREIEAALGLSASWLDAVHPDYEAARAEVQPLLTPFIESLARRAGRLNDGNTKRSGRGGAGRAHPRGTSGPQLQRRTAEGGDFVARGIRPLGRRGKSATRAVAARLARLHESRL